jgi:hypothetical protein
MSDLTTISDQNFQAAKALAKAGFAVFPVGSDKRPLVRWKDGATTDMRQLNRWWRKWPDAMPALPTGERNGVAVLDIDTKNGKDGMAELDCLGIDLTSLSIASIKTPSGGQHIYFRHADGLRCSASKIAPGVDVRAAGGFVVAPGAINGKGEYGALSLELLAALPEWPEMLAPAYRPPAKHEDAKPTGLPLDVISSALDALPNDGDAFTSRDEWLLVGMALHAESGGGEDGGELWHGWSSKWPGYDEAATDEAWQSFSPDGGVTGWHIIHEAERHGWRDDTVTQLLWLDDLPDEDDAEIAALVGSDPIADMTGTKEPPRLTFLSPADCADLPARPYVIKGLVAERDVSAIVGAPGAGKSLLAPKLAFAVATGAEVFGRRTRQGGVFYVAAEDGHGMRARLSALRTDLGDADQLSLVDGVADLLSKKGELAELRNAVKEQRPSLVVIDTLAVAFPGLEENSAEGMGQVVKAARSLTIWGAAVILIHHDTKAGDGLPRGHSLLNGALDMALQLKRDGDVVMGRPSKNRNGTTEQELAFTIGTREVGIDEDGDPITTAICEELDVAKVQTSGVKLTPSAIAAMDIFRELSKGTRSVRETNWRQAVIDSRKVSASDDPDSRRKAFKRAVEELTRKEKVNFADGLFTERDSHTEDFTDDFPE